MKKRILTIAAAVIAVSVGLVWAYDGFYPLDRDSTRVEPGQSHSLQQEWELVGSLTAGVTTPGVTARTSATFNVTDPNNLIYKIPASWNGVRIRVASTTDGDTTVTDVFLLDSDDYDSVASVTSEFNRVATLTWTTGTQKARATGDEWADTCVETNGNWYSGKSEALSPTGNYIAEYGIDAMGATYIGFSGTTVTNAAKVYIKGL